MIRITFWTAFFLVLLRVCIGWHFFFEGVSKVKSAYLGKSVANEKPFSSETYFRESESWLGKKLKPMLLGDPDKELAEKLTPVEGAFPPSLASEWDAYEAGFKSHFALNEAQTAEADKLLENHKAHFVKWVDGDDGIDPKTKQPKRYLLKVKRKAPGNNPGGDFEEEITVARRTKELLKKSDEVKAQYAKFIEMGKDVDGASLRTLKGDVTAIRTELQKELDDQTKKLKDDLAKLLDPRIAGYVTKVESKNEIDTLNEMLTPMSDGKNPLAKLWNDYAAFVKDFSPGLSEGQKVDVDLRLKAAIERFDRWLAGKDMFTGEALPMNEVAEWKALYENASKPDPKLAKAKTPEEIAAEQKLLVGRMQAELKNQTDALRTEIGKTLGDDRSKGYVPPLTEYYYGFIPKWKPIEYMDWTTRWFLAVIGSMLMAGLFTRSSCFLAAGFLLMTNLIQPSVPWLPTAPNNEGNYLFINKNMIEMMALLALMTTRSGVWAGLDSIIVYVFGRRKTA
ncbi:DoxX family protein [Zavarzinella formosa]|uniref:DoxX family protein n=1 Tax=Zavarzinella formosa TaxID=360055 RepID=UPI0002FD9480|nr:DoxX family protein [Zavarzinella formosa]